MIEYKMRKYKMVIDVISFLKIAIDRYAGKMLIFLI